MSTKAFKSQLLAAVAMVLVAVIALGSSTFAWFAMNNKVTATGMSVTTQVSNNLFIADAALTDDAIKADTAFKTSLVETIGQLLEPVSTVDGKAFYYTDTSNVGATGDAISEVYVAYNHASTDAFNENYGIESPAVAKGYVDYVFQLKAINTEDTEAKLKLTKLNLTYGTEDDNEGFKAFRAAVFMNDVTSTYSSTLGTPTIFAPSSSTNITVRVDEGEDAGEEDDEEVQQAVNSATTLGDVTYNSPDLTKTIDANTTKYYLVVVRLWLEGEDTKCSSTTFAQLSDKWHFNVGFELDNDDSATAVTSLNTAVTASKANLATATLSATETLTIDTVVYTKINTVMLGSDALYVKGNALAHDSRIFIIEDDTYPIDVTNQCTLPAPPAVDP